MSKALCFVLACACLFCGACGKIVPPNYVGPLRTFSTSFESASDFSGFYVVPPGAYDSCHELSSNVVHDGQFAHKAWILAARADNNDGLAYRPHRAYPTIQFQKTSNGVFRTPCLVTLWVDLDLVLVARPHGHINDWVSFATLTPDVSRNWSRVVCVNLGPDGYLRLVHVPRQGQQQHLLQVSHASDPTGALVFPRREWVRIDVYIDFDQTRGCARLWQDGMLVSHAKVEGGRGALAQAHFGLYASAAIPSGTVYNDRLRIAEVSNESEALSLVNAPW